jgi:hypothetical protein
MGDLSDRLLCALEGKPCATTAHIDRFVLPDGTVWDKGKPPRPLCATCPEHDKPQEQRHISCLTVVRRYDDWEKVPEAVLAAIGHAREH